MRILIVSNLYPPHYLGGCELLCEQVVKRLVARGHELRVLTSNHGGGPAIEQADGVRVSRTLRLDVPFGRPPSIGRWLRVRVGRDNTARVAEAIAADRPDVVFLWSQRRLTLGGMRAVQAAGVPSVSVFNDDSPVSFIPSRFGWAPKRLVRYATDRTVFRSTTLAGLDFTYTTCISNHLRRRLLAQGVPISGARVICQGIPIRQFPCKEDPGSIHSPVRLLYVGQLLEAKGVHTLLEAARLLKGVPKRTAVALTIVGAGDRGYEARLRDLAHGVVDVDFRGKLPHDQLPEVYREHDIFVFPTVGEEGFGLTQLEAMASGATVVSTAHSGHGECLHDGTNALVFERGDAEGLAERLRRLIEHPDLSRQLAQTARALVAERFTLDRYVADLEALLKEAAGK